MKQITLYILFISSICFSQLDNTESISKTGTTSAQFLKIGADARGASMGNAFTAMSGGEFIKGEQAREQQGTARKGEIKRA